MASPFPPSSSSPGKGELVVELVPQRISALSKMSFQYPLKLISPSMTSNHKSALVFLLTYGGGLVAGDQVRLKILVKQNSKLSIVTQGHTKIFKSPTRDIITKQSLSVVIESGASLCLLPDPVQPFGESVCQLYQIFNVAEDGNLCLLDWVSAGRTARGEVWDLWSWSGRNEIWSTQPGDSKPRLLLRDNVLLDSPSSLGEKRDIKHKMHDLDIFGTLILHGPEMESLAAFFLTEFAALPRIGARDFRSQERKDKDSIISLSHHEMWREKRLKQELRDGVLWSAAKVRGCTVIKFGANTVEGGRLWVGGIIIAEGTVSRYFGEDSLMCVK